MKACYILFAAACCVGVTPSVWAWDETGHMLIAEVAWEKMAADGATVARDHVARLAPLLRSKQAPYHFVTGSAWLDDVRSLTSGPWHYILAPWTPGGADFLEPPGPDALRVIDEKIARLREGGLTDEEEARDAYVVMHLVGDIHMPLHCVDHDGDFLGTLVRVSGVPGMSTLHALWDAGYKYDEVDGRLFIYSDPGKAPAPGQGGISRWAHWLVEQHPPTLGAACLVPAHWARESYRIACTDGYSDLQDLPARRGIKRMVSLKPGYAHRAYMDCCGRITLAGYRLANLLEAIYGSGGARITEQSVLSQLDLEAYPWRPSVR